MQTKDFWIHPQCRQLPSDKVGPFVILSDGGIMTMENNETFITRDDGKTWTKPVVIARGNHEDACLCYPNIFEIL